MIGPSRGYRLWIFFCDIVVDVGYALFWRDISFSMSFLMTQYIIFGSEDMRIMGRTFWDIGPL